MEIGTRRPCTVGKSDHRDVGARLVPKVVVGSRRPYIGNRIIRPAHPHQVAGRLQRLRRQIIPVAITAGRIQRPLPAATKRGKGRRERTRLRLSRDVGDTLSGRPLIAIGAYTGLPPQSVISPSKTEGIRPAKVETASRFDRLSVIAEQYSVEHLASRMRREIAARPLLASRLLLRPLLRGPTARRPIAPPQDNVSRRSARLSVGARR